MTATPEPGIDVWGPCRDCAPADDGGFACARHPRAACIAPAQSGDVLDDLWWKPAPSAGQDTGKLRDEAFAHAIAKTVGDWMAAPHEPEDWQVDNAQDLTDRLLSGPLRQILREHTERGEALERVRELADAYRFMANTLHHVVQAEAFGEVAADLGRALDGTP